MFFKLRPTACPEVLVKLGEGVDIASDRQTLNTFFGDEQIGNGEPMAAPLIFCAARTWADGGRRGNAKKNRAGARYAVHPTLWRRNATWST